MAMESESVQSTWLLAGFHLTSQTEYNSSRDELGNEDEGERLDKLKQEGGAGLRHKKEKHLFRVAGLSMVPSPVTHGKVPFQNQGA